MSRGARLPILLTSITILVCELKLVLQINIVLFKDALPSISQRSIDLLDQCISNFKTTDEFLKELRFFLQNYLHLYQGTELLQDFIQVRDCKDELPVCRRG